MARPRARLAIRSGHGVGKTTFLAWLILWFGSTSDDAKVGVTAPAAPQIETNLWPEIRKWHKAMAATGPVGLWLSRQIEIVQDAVKWSNGNRCTARTARPDSPPAHPVLRPAPPAACPCRRLRAPPPAARWWEATGPACGGCRKAAGHWAARCSTSAGACRQAPEDAALSVYERGAQGKAPQTAWLPLQWCKQQALRQNPRVSAPRWPPGPAHLKRLFTRFSSISTSRSVGLSGTPIKVENPVTTKRTMAAGGAAAMQRPVASALATALSPQERKTP